jgi:hypothetical protein
VASFCTKCGAALNPGTQFCTACGAPTNVAPATIMPPPPPVQAGSGSGAVKVILIIVGVIIALGIVGASIFAFTIWRVSRAIHVEGNGDKVTLSTPGGTFSANNAATYSASDLGIAIYPGATGAHGGSKIETPNGSVVTAIFVTTDSKDQVVSFYKSKLGNSAQIFDTANGAIMSMKSGEHESVMVTVNANSTQEPGKTQIAIVHSHSTKS